MSDVCASLPDVRNPDIRLFGEVSEEMARHLIDRLGELDQTGATIVVEITTPGGDAETARRMVLELDLARARIHPRRLVFLGKTTVYSAGATLMGAFPQKDRFLTADSWLMIHGRQLEKDASISGPMRANLGKIEALREQIKNGLRFEEAGFRRIIAGSRVTFDDICGKAQHNWYLDAAQAERLGLVAGVVPVPDYANERLSGDLS